MSNAMKKCPACGAEIAKSAKNCPQCGAKNKKPLTKKWWFWAIIIVCVGGVIGNMGGSNEPTPVNSSTPSANNTTGSTPAPENTSTAAPAPVEQKPDPIVVDVDTLITALNDNALSASNTYKDAYVEITGRLSTIDSGGKYFSILPVNDEWAIIGVQCTITKEQQSIVAGFSKDQSVTVIGTITNVGEILGYTLKVESIK